MTVKLENELGSLPKCTILKSCWIEFTENTGVGKRCGRRSYPGKPLEVKMATSMGSGFNTWSIKWSPSRKSWTGCRICRSQSMTTSTSWLQCSRKVKKFLEMDILLRVQTEPERCFRPIPSPWQRSRGTSTFGRSHCRQSWKLWWEQGRLEG